jgi:putative membrane protein
LAVWEVFVFSLFKDLKTKGLQNVWNTINGNFLLAIFGGVSISLTALSRVVAWLIDEKPIALWSFFFGLVVASIVFVFKKIDQWQFKTILSFTVGTAVAYMLTTWGVYDGSSGLFYLFLSGAIAICAMILPGISGAFILIILGSYHTILDAVNSKDLLKIFVFSLGAIVGILSFSKLLKWLFNNYKNATLAVLTGFMTGALVKIWPWKTVLSYRINSDGIQVPFSEKVVLPTTYNGDPNTAEAFSLMALGFVLIFILERIGTKSKSCV